MIELRHWARGQEIGERWRQSLHNPYLEINAGQSEAAQKEDRVLAIVRRLGAVTPAEVRHCAPDLSTTDAADLLARLARAGALQITGATHKGTPRYGLGET